MPYIGNIVQDFSVNTAMLNSDSVTSIKIDDGTIVNADVNDSAAIAGTKINPSFGSQTISVVSDQTNPSLQISGSGPNFIRFLDSGGTSTSIDLAFRTSSNRLQFENAGSAANIFSLDVDDNQATFAGNVDIASGLDVTGNITGTGNLSIGTSSPSAKFHVASTAATVACLQRTSSGANVVLQFQNDASSMFCGLTSTATGFAIDDDNDLGSGPMLFVRRSDGNLGIGTATPVGTLSLSDQNPNIRFDDEDTSNNAEITLDNTQLRIEVDEDNSVSNSALKFRIDGSDKAVINSDGNLGLGTTSLAALSGDSGRLLHLAGANNPEIVLERTTSGTEAKASFRISNNKDLNIAVKDGSASTIDALSIDSTSGNVGIGTVSPSTRLQVGDGAVDSSNVIKLGKRISSSNTNLPLIGHHSDGTGSGIAICATSGDGAIHFFTGNGAAGFGASNNDERMRIDSSGNVGIGTTSPTNQLHIYDSAAANDTPELKIDSFRPAIRLRDRSSSAVSAEIVGDGCLKFSVSTPVDDNTALEERMRIDSSGDVLINRSTSLDVASTASSKLQVQHAAGNISAAFYSTADALGPGGVLALGHSRNSSSGVLQDNDVLGQIRFAGADGGDLRTIGATISAEVNGTPSSNVMPTDLVFFTNAGSGTTGERMRLLKSGGLAFNGDTAAANALDDYEEGSLTWKLKKSDESTGSDNGSVVRYVKVGRLVHISGRIRTDSTGSSGSGFFQFTSSSTLPFTPETNGTAVIGHFRSQDQEDSSLTASIAWQSGSTTLYLYTIDSRADYTASTNNVPVSSQTNLVITFSLTYRANS